LAARREGEAPEAIDMARTSLKRSRELALNIRADIDKAWRDISNTLKIRPLPAHDFRPVLLTERQVNEAQSVRLEPWLSIIDEGIQFLACLATSLNERRRWHLTASLIGAACAHAVSMRHLITAGLDSSARILLRSTTDALSICQLTLADKTFRDRYYSVTTPKEAADFWRQHLNYKRLEEGLCAIEIEKGLPAEARAHVKAARTHSLQFYSAYVHSSALPALLTFWVPSLRTTGMKIGVIGHLGIASLVTCKDLIDTLWYHSLAIYSLLFRPTKKSGLRSFRFNKASKLDQITELSFRVFQQLARAHLTD
jgi:hypothetical protein